MCRILTLCCSGNMVSDADRQITRIGYDPRNQPQRIDYLDGSHVGYTYDADGAKLRVDYELNTCSAVLLPTDGDVACDSSAYVHTWREYVGNCVYENDTLRRVLIDGGYITFEGATRQPLYHYYAKDYLGNNRAVADEAGRIEEINHYYPFGGLMGDSRSTATQPYKYIGKELDRTHGLDWYDHGARHYDPVTGRWNVVDAMAEKYYPWSPYVSCLDNPITFIDVKGDSAWSVKRQWNEMDFQNFSYYAHNRLMYYHDKNIKLDCADLSISVLIDYASENGLPLKLLSLSKAVFDSTSDSYNSIEDFKKGNKKVKGALSLTAKDIKMNTFIISKEESEPGDMIILTRPCDHIMNILSKAPAKLIYGNLQNGLPTTPEIHKDWTDKNIQSMEYYPGRKFAHRWIFLK